MDNQLDLRDLRYFEVIAETPLELAITSARAEVAHPPKLITPDDVAVEIRGAGNAARQINHIIAPSFPADKLLVVEVFTPSGNWSSYPPHKHDVHNMPAEADLEEIYYYRIYPEDGFGLQRLHTADGSVDEAYVIHDGDLLIVDRSITARPGHTVVVLWEGGFTVKKLYCRDGRIVLASSAGYPPIIVPEDVELDIWGVVRSNVHFHV